MKSKIIVFLIAIFTATSVAADERTAISDFFKNATKYAKERDYASFKSLYCGNPPASLGKTGYFENKNKKFSEIKLAPRQHGLFDNIQHDFVLYLCSHEQNKKEICMVQPVIRKKARICIVNIMGQWWLTTAMSNATGLMRYPIY